MQDQEVIREFLVESHENLSRLDQELVELEKHPRDAALLASIFRTIHTIKGTCGFLAFLNSGKDHPSGRKPFEPVARRSAGAQSVPGVPDSGDGRRDPKGAGFDRSDRRGRLRSGLRT